MLPLPALRPTRRGEELLPYQRVSGYPSRRHSTHGIAVTHSGKGYWEVGADGGVFAFGDAPFLGSIYTTVPGGKRNGPIVGIQHLGSATASPVPSVTRARVTGPRVLRGHLRGRLYRPRRGQTAG